MVATGKIIKLNIRFKNIYISLKDYILHLTKLILLKQKCLYIDWRNPRRKETEIMSIPTRKSVKDEIKKRYPNGVPKAETRDRSGLNRLGKDLNRAVSVGASAVSDILFGENDPELPLPISLIPGADLVDKTSKGLRPGLIDIPGANIAKAAALLGLSKSALMDLFRQFGSKIAAKTGEKTADLVGKDLANRLMRLPEELREPAAATIIGKKGTVPLLDVPGVDAGNPLSTEEILMIRLVLPDCEVIY